MRSRSDVTITLVGSSQTVTVGDEYYLTVDGNSSSATTVSGIVASKEVVDGNTRVTFTDVWENSQEVGITIQIMF